MEQLIKNIVNENINYLDCDLRKVISEVGFDDTENSIINFLTKYYGNNYSKILLDNLIDIIKGNKTCLVMDCYSKHISKTDIELIQETFSQNCLNLNDQDNLVKYAISDKKFKNNFINSCMWMVSAIAFEYANYNLDLSDLIIEGSIGILNTIENYDLRRHQSFSFRVRLEILKSIKEYINNSYNCELSLDDICDDGIMNEYSNYVVNVEDLAIYNLYYKDLFEICNYVLSEKELFILKSIFELENFKRLTYKDLGSKYNCSTSYIGNIFKKIIKKVNDEIKNKNIVKIKNKKR